MLDLRSLENMMKIRSILMSFLLLLLVGVDMNVRAANDSNKSIQKASDEENSEKESQDREPKETISKLDFFGAFSLVNIQLQWRDLHIGSSQEATTAKSSLGQKLQLKVEEKNLSVVAKKNVVQSTSIFTENIELLPGGIYCTIIGSTYVKAINNAQQIRMIAYIYHCGTYPESC